LQAHRAVLLDSRIEFPRQWGQGASGAQRNGCRVSDPFSLGFAMNRTIRWWFCIGSFLLSACDRRNEPTPDSQIAPIGFPDQTASVVESKPSSPITKTFSLVTT
jgi:hypothetical protein